MGIIERMRGNRGGLSSAGFQQSFKKPDRSFPKITKAHALILACVGGCIVAFLALLVPVYRLEILTGATGISEIIPAARPPLGFTARILFIGFFAILSSSILLIILMSFTSEEPDEYMALDEMDEMARRRNRMPVIEDENTQEPVSHQNQSRHESFEHNQQLYSSSQYKNYDRHRSQKQPSQKKSKNIFTKLKSSVRKLPFMGGDDSVRSFDDLPKLRSADSHPDAPPRRPLSAHNDLGDQILDSQNYKVEPSYDELDLDEASSNTRHLQEIELTEIEDTHNILPQDRDDEYIEHYKDSADIMQNDMGVPIANIDEQDAQYYDEDVSESPGVYYSDQVEEDIVSTDEGETIYTTKTHQNDAILSSLDDLMHRLDKVVERRREWRNKIDMHKALAENKKATASDSQLSPSQLEISKTANIRHEATEYTETLDDIELPARKIEFSEQHKNKIKAAEPSASVKNEEQKKEMDSALRAALNTLHKMNNNSA